jgi:hypothetical protein
MVVFLILIVAVDSLSLNGLILHIFVTFVIFQNRSKTQDLKLPAVFRDFPSDF